MDFTETQRLGRKAFLYFLTRRLKAVVLLLVLIAILWTQEYRLPPAATPFADYALELLLIATGALLVLRLLRTYFEYRSYAYRFDEEFFQIIRGYMTTQEIGVVYHHIQRVTIRRGMMDRLSGVSHLAIITSGHQDQHQPSSVVLPALDVEVARLVQKELLRQARRRGVTGQEGSPPAAEIDEKAFREAEDEDESDADGEEGE